MTENLIKALLSVKSAEEMRPHLEVRRKGRRHGKRDKGRDSDETGEHEQQRLAVEDRFP